MVKSNIEDSKKNFIAEKGGDFLIKKSKAQDIFIPEEWNEEQKMMHDMVVDFLLKEVHGIGIEKAAQLSIEKDKDFILEVFNKAAEMGFCGVSIAERFGGMELDFNSSLLISEALAVGFSFATTIGAQTSIGSLPIVYYGTEAQKAKYLPGIASGETIAAYALTEPSAGSDANSAKSKATFTDDKQHFLLNGQKMWITNGGFAELFIVFAKIENDEKLSAFIVEKSFGGITIGKEEKKLGIKASSTVQLFFENTKIPIENLLGERQGGFKMALNILNTGRIKLCAGTVGGAKFGITKGIEYAKQREQFGKAISEFGAIKHKLGEMIMRTHIVESALYRTGQNISNKCKELIASGVADGEAKTLAVREFAIECAILKVQGSETASFVCDEVLQIYGGMGYAVETGIEMGYRDVRITRIYEGTNEINRMLAIAELSKRSLKTKEIDLEKAGKRIPTYLAKRALPFSSNTEADQIENLKVLFTLLLGTAGKRLREKMIDEQEMIMNLSDIMAYGFLADSAMLRYKKLIQKGMTNRAAKQLPIIQLYLFEALQGSRKKGEDVIYAFANGTEKSMLLRSLKWLTKLPDINPKELRREIADYGLEKEGYPFL